MILGSENRSSDGKTCYDSHARQLGFGGLQCRKDVRPENCQACKIFTEGRNPESVVVRTGHRPEESPIPYSAWAEMGSVGISRAPRRRSCLFHDQIEQVNDAAAEAASIHDHVDEAVLL